ncbi:unnamed protein product [Thelazia callipaeda]|uniref:NRF domain-containing protein n=1 Tax=Thelazia callipaeda TaxID=103827 RepID=A0A0N5CT08_THECL|nr:unnamed protein product [Thelazia callipaeda]
MDMKLSGQIFSQLITQRGLTAELKLYYKDAILPMIDAAAKFPAGILRGHFITFGQYKECMLVKGQIPNSERTVTGRYVRIILDRNFKNYDADGACIFDEYGIGNPSFDICIFSSCDDYNTLITLARKCNTLRLHKFSIK